MSNKDDFDEMLAAMKEDKERTGQRKFWSPPSDKEGTFPIRILPRMKEKGEKVFYFKHRVHWIDKKSYECTAQDITDKDGNTHMSEDCPICKFVRKLYDSSERGSEDWKLASSLRCQDRYVYRVVVRGKDNETEPVFYETGKSLFDIIYHLIAETDFGNITDMKDGRDFILSKKGVGRLSKYETSSPSASPSPVFSKPDELKALVENMRKMDYTSLIEITPVDVLKKKLQEFISGEGSDDDSGDDEPEIREAAAPAKSEKLATKPVQKVESKEDDIDSILADFEG